MARFCIDRCLLGTKNHLLVSEHGRSDVDIVPDDAWYFTGDIKLDRALCLDTLFRLHGITVETSPDKRFVKSIMGVLSGSLNANPPWRLMMPTAAHNAFTETLVGSCIVAINRCDDRYLRETWGPGNVVLGSLQHAKIDRVRLHALLENGAVNPHVLQTFEPGDDGFAGIPAYDRFGTLTGRLTVKSGPNILVLKKEYRNIISSSTPGGRIMCIDFSALEPRVLLYEAGGRCDEPDMYGSIAQEFGMQRNAIKLAVVSELYGSSKVALGERLGIAGDELSNLVKKIKRLFKTNELLKRIKQQYVSTGVIVNRYGRLVSIDEPLNHVMLNYYAQSTGVDVALLGFSKLCSEFKVTAPAVRPLYLLHDGMYLDVPEENVEYVSSIKTITVPGYVQRFHVKVDTVS